MFTKSRGVILCFSLALSALFTPAAFAQSAATAPAPVKVAIVNIQEAIGTSNEGKKEFEALQQKFNPKAAELKKLKDDIDAATAQLQAQGPNLSDEVRATRARAIEAKQKAYQRNAEDAQAEFQQAEQEILGRIYQKMAKVLEKISQQRGYSVVLDVSAPQSPILFASPTVIITKDLVDAYNTEAPAAAAKAPATGTPRSAGAAATPKKP
ncbi:MAG TPA: OmpH family outer membrane protein [Verrucomicrobiae bacterium]|jgi:outer membrane protein|nr:OmpH family outer membrane protein [Verrucomicrobiae bacterium]